MLYPHFTSHILRYESSNAALASDVVKAAVTLATVRILLNSFRSSTVKSQMWVYVVVMLRLAIYLRIPSSYMNDLTPKYFDAHRSTTHQRGSHSTILERTYTCTSFVSIEILPVQVSLSHLLMRYKWKWRSIPMPAQR